MKKEIFPIVTFIILSITSISYLFYNSNKSKLPIDPKRIIINKNGEEKVVLNQLEKNYVGKWHLTYEGETFLTMKPKNWEHNRYWEFTNTGKVIYHRPEGRNFTSYWQISEADSILSLIKLLEKKPDTLRYKIYSFGENNFAAYVLPNKSRSISNYYVQWEREKINE